MKAKNIYQLGSSPAPKAWEGLEGIKEAMPQPIGHEVSLQRLDGTNICIWYTRTQVYWNPASEPFIVFEQENK